MIKTLTFVQKKVETTQGHARFVKYSELNLIIWKWKKPIF